MGVKFKSPLELSGHRAIAHTDVAQTLVVKVVTKTNAHPEYGNGSSNGYTIDGVEGAYLEFTPGNTYKFDQADSSNSGHPLRFYEDAAKTTAYTTGVTTSGTPGSSGAYTQIIPTVSTPPILFYQCSAHALMGSYVKFGTGSQGDTYTLSATQDGNNVDVLLDAGTGTDSTLQLTAGNNITLTRNNAQEVTIASTASGGGSGTVTVEKNVYTANGSTAAFNTSTAIANENNVQVYIDGVYQSKDDYTVASSTVTLDSNPANGAIVELIHMVAISGVIARDSFTGDGSTTAYVLSMSISNENATQVYLDGVYQSKDNYSTSGSTLTFSTAPSNGTAIEVVHLKAVNATSINQNSFTGDGTTTAFTLSQSIDDENKTFVFLQGVYQEKSTYSISGTTLTFSTAPQNGYTIEVMAFDSITISNQSSTPSTDWQSTIQTSNFTAVAGKGYFINTTSSTITMTMPSSPSVGDTVAVIDAYFKFQTNALTITSSDKINGSTNNFLLNTVGKAVEMVYSGTARGWLVANDADGHAAEEVMEYLVVAGGAAGGNYLGGGGGAGGVRSGSFIPTSGVQYTATVGTGGAGAYAYAVSSAANNGGNSSLAGSGITTISATGGGGGGSYSGGAGASGGSGGGGGIQESSGGGAGGTGNAGGYNPVEGYAGGAGPYRSAGNAYGPCGAGGGASEVGDDGLSNQGTPATGHKGGDGVSSSITGSAVTYGGGGGACTYSGSTANGVSMGGAGGGGNGAGNGQPSTGNNGTDGLGGGGGGGATNSSNTAGKGGDGGDGVVILKIPTLYYTGTTTGSPTITASGAHTIIKFTGSGTYTH